MSFDLGAGRHLVLAGGGGAAIWIAVGAVALLLLLALYRYELRLVSRRVGLALLGTRLLAALVLVAALFEPIAELRHDEHIRGRVILGVDLSQSMATADPVPRAEGSSVSPSEPLADRVAPAGRSPAARRRLDQEHCQRPRRRIAGIRAGHRRWKSHNPGGCSEATRRLRRSGRAWSRTGTRCWPGRFRGRVRLGPGSRRRLADRRPAECAGGHRPRGRSPGGAGHSRFSRDDRLDHPTEGCGDRIGQGPGKRLQGRCGERRGYREGGRDPWR